MLSSSSSRHEAAQDASEGFPMTPDVLFVPYKDTLSLLTVEDAMAAAVLRIA